MKTVFRGLLLLFLALFVVSCTTTQSRYSVLDTSYPAKPAGYEVQVLSEPPSKPFKKIARLDVHMEKAYFISSSLKDAVPELKKQACLAGADAILDIEEKSSMVGETKIYHVTAIGIRYTGD